MVLVQYDSSDEDEGDQMQVDAQAQSREPRAINSSSQTPRDNENTPSKQPADVSSSAAAAENTSEQQAQIPQPTPSPGPQPEEPTGPVLGPTMGPARPDPAGQPGSLQEVDMSFLETEPDPNGDPPKSPYTARRTLLRDLTLPAIDISQLDIPQSPPPSPSSAASQQQKALNAKFDEFLRLKRTKGVHFNERLAGSSMLRNPSLMDKMLGYVGVETEFLGPDDVMATEQYRTTLPADLWDPTTAFPDWAYKGMLRKAQERVAKERERAKGEPVQFVAASPGLFGGGGSSSTGDGGGGGLSMGVGSRAGALGTGPSLTAGKRKSRFDV